MYTVQIDPAWMTNSPKFVNLPPQYKNKVRITLDAYDGSPHNYEWYPRPTSVGAPPDAPIVRERRALYVGLQPVQLVDSIVESNWTANSIMARMLSRYVEEGLIIVKKNGTPVTSAQLNAFTTAP